MRLLRWMSRLKQVGCRLVEHDWVYAHRFGPRFGSVVRERNCLRCYRQEWWEPEPVLHPAALLGSAVRGVPRDLADSPVAVDGQLE